MEKVAVVDLGTTKVDLVLANILPCGNYVVFEEMSEKVKIISDIETDGIIRVSRIEETMAILKMYKTICDVNHITNIVAVASHHLIELKNYRSFFDEIYNTCGFKLKLLDDNEELTMLYYGVINSLDIPRGLIVNISGGSTRLVQYNRKNILNETVLPIGTYNIAQIAGEGVFTSDVCDKMVDKFASYLNEVSWLKDVGEEYTFIGVGSIFMNAGYLARKASKYPLEIEHNYQILPENFDKVYNLIRNAEIDKNKKIKGLSSERADMVASGICMIKSLLRELNIPNFVVSSKGIKEGILADYVFPCANEKQSTDLLTFSLDTITSAYDNIASNNKQVSNLASILYRQLKVLHKLPRTYIKVLKIAAALHDCGKRIKFENYEKNCFHIILNSDIMGATHKDILLAAFVASSQNQDDFSLTEWIKYKDLVTDDDLVAVRKLAMIIKLADSLDRTNRSAVEDISCDILGDSVIMKTIITLDASIEIKETTKYYADFKKIFGKSLEVL